MNDQIHQKVGLDLDLRGDQLVPAALEDDRHWLFDAPRLPSIDLCRFS